jgi:ATP-dependent Clp protease ATP-binding subunit ClpA
MADPQVEFLHVNLSQFKGKQAFSQLQGATAGHKGYGDATPLHDLLGFPKSLVLLDEVDKSDPVRVAENGMIRYRLT